MNAMKVDSILAWPRPVTVKKLVRFLGAANYYRQFIKNFSAISSPLDAMRKQKGLIK